MHRIFIISDGTGGTAEQILRSALAQFKDAEADIQRRPEIRTPEQVLSVVQEAELAGGFIAHTVVSNDLRTAIGVAGRLHDVETIDLMGPLLTQLTILLSDTPAERPGLFRSLNKEYFQRIEAMEYAFRHDDGQRTHQLMEADIVLLGVSRTFKTPLSIYLAFKGWLVGNVPVILDLPLPPEVMELPAEKVFCLSTVPRHLSILRRARHEHLGGATGDYAKVEHVRREIAYADDLFSRWPGWPVIQVTNKPIEEIASEILKRMRISSVSS